MLTKDACEVMDYLIDYFSKNSQSILLSDMRLLLKTRPLHELESTFEYLKKEKYVIMSPYDATYLILGLTYEGKHYKELKCPESSATNSSVFNIHGSVSNSVFGNTGQINVSYTFADLREAIEKSDSRDKESLNEIVDILEQFHNDNIPIKKGVFSKFKDVIERNDFFIPLLMSSLLSLVIT